MSRQHAAPVLLPADGMPAAALAPLPLNSGPGQIAEEMLQAIVHQYPACLPIAEIDPLFANPVPICMEMNTPAGPIDNFLVTATGMPVLVECKLWRNPEARREVVGQILDYAKELARWTSADVQREVRRRLGRNDDPVLELVRAAGHVVDETDFGEALSINLRRGRFLLLIVGDGIREGVEAIAEYLQAHAGLHFSLGLVEMPIHLLPGGDRIVVPRVLARTHVITRTVVAVPEGYIVNEDESVSIERSVTVQDETALERERFWTDFVASLALDDPDQAIPKPNRQSHVWLTLPAPAGSCWLTVFRAGHNRVGVFLSYTRETIGERAALRIIEDWDDVRAELGGRAMLSRNSRGKPIIEDQFEVGALNDPIDRSRAIGWLAERTNDFVNVIRPRIKSAIAEMTED